MFVHKRSKAREKEGKNCWSKMRLGRMDKSIIFALFNLHDYNSLGFFGFS